MAEDWGSCLDCGSRRKGCSDADACCAECRITAGLTHDLTTSRPLEFDPPEYDYQPRTSPGRPRQ